MIEIGAFLELLSPMAVYDSGYQLAVFVASFITPFLLALAIGIRTLETQVDALTSGVGRWGRFIRDMGVWTTVLAVYFGLALLINEVFTTLYQSFSSVGSLSLLMEQFSGLLTKIEAAGEVNSSFTDGIVNLFSSPVLGIAYFVYYISLILVAFVGIFLQLAHAIAYAFAISWGLVAIPMSITTSFKLLAPWAKFSGVVLVWPIIHFIAFALFTPLFVEAGTFFIEGNAMNMTIDKAQVYLLYTIVNFIACALIVAAPFVAQTLISSGSITGLVAPFAMAGMGAAGSVLRVGKEQMIGAGQWAVGGIRRSANEGMIGEGLRRAASTISPSINPVPQPATSNAVASGAASSAATGSWAASSGAGQRPLTTVAPTAVASTANAQVTPAAKVATGTATSQEMTGRPVTPASDQAGADENKSSDAQDTQRQRQARRGAILNQKQQPGQHKPKG